MINPMLIIIFVSITVMLLTVFFLFVWLQSGGGRYLSNRLANISSEEIDLSVETPLILKSDELSHIPLFDKYLRSIKVAYHLRRILDSANLSITVGQLVLFMLTLAGIGILLTLRTGEIFIMGIAALLFGGLPMFVVLKIKSKRLNTFEQQFPDALDIIRNAMRAGFALNRALQMVGDESPDPVGMEFRKTFEEINLGIPFKDSLMNMTRRIDSMDLKLFVTALLIQRESGGNLNELLLKLTNTIRARFKLTGQIKVYTAQGRLSQIILGLLPIAIGLIISLINPDYIKVLFIEPVGRILLGVAVFLQALGYIVIRMILKT